MNRILVVFAFLLMAGQASAQIPAPDFECVTDDSLRWQNTSSNCGPFEAIEIYSSTVRNGPYTRIAELFDPAATTYFDMNPSGEQRFYYLVYRYNCVGQFAAPSDTLDNRIPQGVQLQSINIDGDDIILNWLPSPSPQTDRYIIYIQEPAGFQPIDTVPSGSSSYTDSGRAAADAGQTYAVTSLDACDNNSLFGAQVSTLLLEASGGQGCVSDITLSLPPYAQTNMAAASELVLLVSRDGCTTFSELGSYDPTTTEMTYSSANDGESLCFVVEAVLANGNGRPRSQPAEVLVNIDQPIRPFPLYQLGYTADGALDLAFDWDAAALVEELELNMVQLATGVNMPQLLDPSSLSDGQNAFTLPANQSGQGPHQVYLTARDQCDNSVITNRITSSWLSLDSQAGTNTLAWTAFDDEVNRNFSYELYRTDALGNSELVYSGSDLSYVDQIDPNAEGAYRLCYQIVINYQLSGLNTSSTSNEVCAEQIPGMYVPNVFSPVAQQVLNREFCPSFARIPTGDYRLDIWDRWGAHLFSSASPDNCWDGTDSGREAKSGVYLYHIQLELGGRQLEQNGTITLIR